MFDNYTFGIIDSTCFIMKLFYYIGLFACSAYGSEKSRMFRHTSIKHFILNGFGGGLVRDFCFLGSKIWLFTPEAIPDITFTILSGLFYTRLVRNESNTRRKNLINNIVFFFDALSLSSFIAVGIDKAISLGFIGYKAIICGYVTAACGGLMANYRRPYAIITPSNLCYQFIVFIGSTFYYFSKNAYLICIFITVCLLFERVNYHAIFMSNYSICLLVLIKAQNKLISPNARKRLIT